VVLLSSNCKGIEEETEVKRYDKRQRSYLQVKCPRIVSDYNTYMSRADLVDRMVSYYRLETRTKKWTVCLFHHFVDAALANAFHELRGYGSEVSGDLRQLIDLRFNVAECLLNYGSSGSRGQANSDEERLGKTEHRVLSVKKRPIPPQHAIAALHLPEFCDLANAARCRRTGCCKSSR
jgi:hypothetical protein